MSAAIPNGDSHEAAHPLVGATMAYPAMSPAASAMTRLTLFMRYHSRAVVAVTAFVCFIFILSLDQIQHSISAPNLRGGGRRFGGAAHPGYFTLDKAISEKGFSFAAVTDMDQLSKDTSARKPSFKAKIVAGTLKKDGSGGNVKYRINFENSPREIKSGLNEAGRGMELSELTAFDNRLLTFDDRTGTVFEVLNKNKGESIAVPRFILTEGDGDNDKGMKWEWATVKDGELVLGSMGKEYTNKEGEVENRNNLWIAHINKLGEIRREDWSSRYIAVRNFLGAAWPGYCIHEAILWSSSLRKWVFLPRRVSPEPYDDVLDEKRGSNVIVLADESFSNLQKVEIKFGKENPLHGFSSAAFVPGSNDHHVLALRSVEEDCALDDESQCKQRSFFTVFDITTGAVLLDETQYEAEDFKLEGVEFVNIHSLPPSPASP